MPQPREWPNKAAAARDRSAERAVAGLRALYPIISGAHLSQEETVRKVAQASTELSAIVRLMESVGARSTDPTSEDF